MNRTLCCGLLATALLLSGCATKPPPKRAHQETVDALGKVKSIAVLPMEVSYTRVAFTGENERVPETERSLDTYLSSQILIAVKARNYAVRELPQEQSEQQKQEVAFELQQLNSALAAAIGQPTEAEDETTRPRVFVGPAAGTLANRLNADALLLARYSGFDKTGGQKAKEAMTGAILGVRYATQGGVMSVVLIDGVTGEVLWMGAAGHARFPGRQPPGRHANYSAAANEVLGRFPFRIAPQ